MKMPANRSNYYHDQDFDHVPDCLFLLYLNFKPLPVTIDAIEDSGVGEGGYDHFEYFPNRFFFDQKLRMS